MRRRADMAELADAPDLGSGGYPRAGSTPVIRTIEPRIEDSWLFYHIGKACKIVDFHEKLQELRKRKGITQEELAALLYVSRTAVSKWESGRGYPNLDSLKALSTVFSVTVDELLSGDELLCLAQEESQQKQSHLCDLVFGLLDCSIALFFFLPLFGQKVGDVLQECSLLTLSLSPYLRACYFVLVIGIILFGVLTLVLQPCRCPFWIKNKHWLSITLSAIGTLLFIVSTQPYAAALLFIFLLVKVLMQIKRA